MAQDELVGIVSGQAFEFNALRPESFGQERAGQRDIAARRAPADTTLIDEQALVGSLDLLDPPLRDWRGSGGVPGRSVTGGPAIAGQSRRHRAVVSAAPVPAGTPRLAARRERRPPVRCHPASDSNQTRAGASVYRCSDRIPPTPVRQRSHECRRQEGRRAASAGVPGWRRRSAWSWLSPVCCRRGWFQAEWLFRARNNTRRFLLHTLPPGFHRIRIPEAFAADLANERWSAPTRNGPEACAPITKRGATTAVL